MSAILAVQHAERVEGFSWLSWPATEWMILVARHQSSEPFAVAASAGRVKAIGNIEKSANDGLVIHLAGSPRMVQGTHLAPRHPGRPGGDVLARLARSGLDRASCRLLRRPPGYLYVLWLIGCDLPECGVGSGGRRAGRVHFVGLLLLFTGACSLRREIAAFLLFAVAFAIKPQVCLVLPVMLHALYRRYLLRRRRSEWFEGLRRIAMIGALPLGLWFVSGLPFGLDPVELLRFYHESASTYPGTSANAFNL
jgi:hypothetical protein